MATFDAIKSEVSARLGNRTNIDSRLQVWINDAYFELLLNPRASFFELDKQATTQTIDTLRSYNLPTDLWFILDVRDFTNSVKLRRGHWQTFDKRSPSSGTPRRYARFGNTIELDPTPNVAVDLIIRYRMRPTELSSSVALVTPREWDEVITTLSVAKGFEALQQFEEAAKQRQLLEALLNIRLDVPKLEDIDSETTIGVRLE